MVEHPLRSPHAAGLLVGDTEVDEVALRLEATAGEVSEGDRHRGGQVQHVNRSATPHLFDTVGVANEFTAEGVTAPAVGADRHDVGVAHEAERRCIRVAAFNASDDRLAAVDSGVALGREACAFEEVLEGVGVAGLVTRFRSAVVDAGVADHRLEQFDGFPGECRHGRILGLGLRPAGRSECGALPVRGVADHVASAAMSGQPEPSAVALAQALRNARRLQLLNVVTLARCDGVGGARGDRGGRVAAGAGGVRDVRDARGVARVPDRSDASGSSRARTGLLGGAGCAR